MGANSSDHEMEILTVYERRELYRSGFEALLPSYEKSLACVRRGKKMVGEADQRSLLNSCERDLSDSLSVIKRRSKEAYYGDLLELNRSIFHVLTNRELALLSKARYKSIRGIAEEECVAQSTISSTIHQAIKKINEVRCLHKNKILWLLKSNEVAFWELKQAGVSLEDASEILGLGMTEIEELSRAIKRATKIMELAKRFDPEILNHLSIDQRQIYFLIEAGYSNCEIMKFLDKSKGTIEKQKARIKEKLKKA